MTKKRKNGNARVPPKKRVKLSPSDIFSDNKGQQQRPSDVLKGESTEAGFIVAQLVKVRPLHLKSGCTLDVQCTQDGGVKIPLQVSFGEECAARLSHLGVVFVPSDTVAFALRGVHVESHDSVSGGQARGSLNYANGVVLKILHKVGLGECDYPVIDTYTHNFQTGEDESWFPSPPRADRSMDPRGASIQTKILAPGKAPSGSTSTTPTFSKNTMKRLTKQMKNEQRMSSGPGEATIPPAQTLKSNLKVSSNVTPPPNESPSKVSPNKSVSAAEPEVKSKDYSERLFKSGLKTTNYTYNSVEDLPKLNGEHGTIALVLSCTPPELTASKDWSCTIKIFDPSTFVFSNGNYLGDPEIHTINCFTPKYPQWLPCPKRYDVVILSHLKSRHGRQNCSVGYKDKLKWFIFDSQTRAPHHGDRGDAPVSEKLGPLQFSPFLEMGPREIEYAASLSAWWKRLESQRRDIVAGCDINIGTVISIDDRRSTTRKFCTIDQIHPDLEPRGFFDCLVEVLRVWPKDDRPCIQVTDYTENSGLHEERAGWCPIALSKRILPIVCWDAAAKFVSSSRIEAHTFYKIQNCRAKMSPNGELEAKIAESKFTKFTEEDADSNPKLKDLLARKRAFEAKYESFQIFPRSLLKDAKIGDHFSCVFKILKTKVDEEASWVWATDYTARSDLHKQQVLDKIQNENEKWITAVLKIQFADEQSHKVADIEPGTFYCINNLRLVSGDGSGSLIGRIGGSAALIRKLDKDSEDEQLKTLLFNQTKWKQDSEEISNKRQTTNENTIPPEFLTIKDLKMMQHQPDSPLLHVVAKVKKIRKKDPHDWYIHFCTKCKKPIQSLYRACLSCNDADHEHVESGILLTLWIEDAFGSGVSICANQDVRWLRDVELSKLAQPEVTAIVKSRVMALSGQETFHYNPDGPWADMILAHDNPDGLTPMFWLIDFAMRQPSKS